MGSFNKFFIGVPFLHFYAGFEMIGECIISLPLMESGEI